MKRKNGWRESGKIEAKSEPRAWNGRERKDRRSARDFHRGIRGNGEAQPGGKGPRISRISRREAAVITLRG